MRFEAAKLRHGNVVVKQPGAHFVVAFDTIGEAERYAASRNQQLEAALDIDNCAPELWAGDVESRLFGILDRLRGPAELWLEAA